MTAISALIIFIETEIGELLSVLIAIYHTNITSVKNGKKPLNPYFAKKEILIYVSNMIIGSLLVGALFIIVALLPVNLCLHIICMVFCGALALLLTNIISGELSKLYRDKSLLQYQLALGNHRKRALAKIHKNLNDFHDPREKLEKK